MGSLLRALLYTASLIIITGCGANRSVPAFKSQAPSSPEELGFIVRGIEAAEVKDLINGLPESQVRVINTRHKLYEITDVTEQDILKYAPKAKVSSNQFISKAQPKSNSVSLKQSVETISANKTNEDKEQLKLIDEVMNCIPDSPKQPDPEISIGGQNVTDAFIGTEIGKKIRFSSGLSLNHAEVTGELTAYWFPTLPMGSTREAKIVKSRGYSFAAEDLGEHAINMVIIDSNNSCKRVEVLVAGTKNVAYTLPSLSKILDYNSIMATHGGGVDYYSLVNGAEADKHATGDGVLIAVLDSGINYTHPTLSLKVRLNTKEKPNGIDDDGNGFIDDNIGYDFSNADAYPYDDSGHGSHVAGIAAGLYIGMAQKAQILPVKVLNQFGNGDLATILGGLYYAADNGANIINMSLGLEALPTKEMTRALKYIEAKNITLVTSAGNGDSEYGLPMDIDTNITFPASMANTNIITVAASNSRGDLSIYTNFGVKSVDIAAPGGDEFPTELIYSATYENKLGQNFSGHMGTSMAAPVVAGTIAMMLETNPKMTPAQIKQIIKDTSYKVIGQDMYTASGGILDAGKAVKAAKGLLDKPTALF